MLPEGPLPDPCRTPRPLPDPSAPAGPLGPCQPLGVCCRACFSEREKKGSAIDGELLHLGRSEVGNVDVALLVACLDQTPVGGRISVREITPAKANPSIQQPVRPLFGEKQKVTYLYWPFHMQSL